MSLRDSWLLQVQTELITGLTLVLEGIAETSTDHHSRDVAITSLEHILVCYSQLSAMLDAEGETKH